MQIQVEVNKVIKAIELLRIDGVDGIVFISSPDMSYMEEIYEVLRSLQDLSSVVYLDLFELRLLVDYL